MTSETASWAERGDAARKSCSRPIDLVHLSRYTLGERALEREVLELFCTQSFLYLEQLRLSPTDLDWKSAAHTIKGSARAVGAWQVAEAAQRAEGLAGETLVRFRAAHVEEIDKSLREARAYIGSLLEEV